MRWLYVLLLLPGFAPLLPAATTVLTFEGMIDSTKVANQYPDVIFQNTTVITAGISLNELAFPPHSGTNVAFDDGGPMTLAFLTPVFGFSGYFNYTEPLTLSAFDSSNHLLAKVTSAFSTNLADGSGAAGSTPNEFLHVGSASNIAKVVITGDPAGSSFTLDDAAITTAATVPEPSSFYLGLAGFALAGALARGRWWWKRRTSLPAALLVSLTAGSVGALATPTFSAPASSAASVFVGVPSRLTITSELTTVAGDHALLANGVNLLLLNSSGQTLSTLGVMHDDGLNGDAVAGDGIFTLLVNVTEPSTGQLFLQVSAAFQGSLLRVKSPVETVPVVVADSNAVMGFEILNDWNASSSGASETTTRTEGTSAYALKNSSNLVTLTSIPVSSTATALAGVGEAGALFEVDVMPPVSTGNQVNKGSIELLVSSASRHLNNVAVGTLALTAFRPGIYSTLAFPIPDAVRASLSGAAFNDLVFQFKVSSLDLGTYLFDNLRVHAVALVTAKTGTLPPPGYGGSINLVATGSAPVSQSFNAGPIQVPDAFHLKTGTAGTTTVQLELGYAAVIPAITCLYNKDSNDATGKSYILTSCNGVVQAGDIASATWAQLRILNGNSTMKIEAQLATNPVGELVGGSVIPAMPTFWGDSDTCTPAPKAGTVVTVSASCTAQVNEANQIVTGYFNKVNNSGAAANWVVAPVPAFAVRNGDGASKLIQFLPPPNSPAFPFDQEGHLNQGGSWDAYWRLNGNLDAENIAGTDQDTTTFDATFGGHVVLFGDDVDVADIEIEAGTSTGQTTPVPIGPSSNGSVHFFLFGTEIPTGGFSTNLNTFNVDQSLSQNEDAPPIQIWIFDITVGAVAKIGVTATGSVTANGINVVFTPNASLGVHIQGTVSIVIASGGVDAEVDLFSVATPLAAAAQWAFNFDPAVCGAKLDGTLAAQEQLGSLGGEVDLVASFGLCPFCKDESWTLFKWDPVALYTRPLFTSPIANAAGLPAARCTAPLSVQIFSPISGAAYPANLPIKMTGYVTSPNNAAAIPCENLKWTFAPAAPGNTANPPTTTGCNPLVSFSQPNVGTTASWTAYLNASQTYVNQFGTITETGAATPIRLPLQN